MLHFKFKLTEPHVFYLSTFWYKDKINAKNSFSYYECATDYSHQYIKYGYKDENNQDINLTFYSWDGIDFKRNDKSVMYYNKTNDWSGDMSIDEAINIVNEGPGLKLMLDNISNRTKIYKSYVEDAIQSKRDIDLLKSFLETLGIRLELDNSNNMLFYDISNNEKIKAYLTTTPVNGLDVKNDIDKDETCKLYEFLDNDYTLVIYSKDIFLAFNVYCHLEDGHTFRTQATYILYSKQNTLNSIDLYPGISLFLKPKNGASAMIKINEDGDIEFSEKTDENKYNILKYSNENGWYPFEPASFDEFINTSIINQVITYYQNFRPNI